MIPEAHAIVDPWAMMIHLQDTDSADPAMMATIRFVLGTPFATPSVSSLLALRSKANRCQLGDSRLDLVFLSHVPPQIFLLLWDGPWMHQYALHVTYEQQDGDRVKYSVLPQSVLVTDVLPSLFGLGSRCAMIIRVDKPQSTNNASHESNGKEFDTLCKTILSIVSSLWHDSTSEPRM